MKHWSDWAETFTRGDHDSSSELFFFVSKNLYSFHFYCGKTEKFSRNLVVNYKKPFNLRRECQNWKQKKSSGEGSWSPLVKISAQSGQFFIRKPLSQYHFLVKNRFSRKMENTVSLCIFETSEDESWSNQFFGGNFSWWIQWAYSEDHTVYSCDIYHFVIALVLIGSWWLTRWREIFTTLFHSSETNPTKTAMTSKRKRQATNKETNERNESKMNLCKPQNQRYAK